MAKPIKGACRCQGTVKATGEQCKKYAIAGTKYCRSHTRGRPFQKGTLNPAFKHGRFSTHLPTRMLETYEEAASDPELLELKSAIALTQSRIVDLIKRADTGESGYLWDKLAELKEQFLKAQAPDTQHLILNQMFDLIGTGQHDSHAWREVFDLVEKQRRLTDSEAKRLERMGQYITYEQGVVLITRLLAVIRNHVTDQAVLNAIADEVRQMEYFAGQR
mgnify:FL=1